MIRREGESWEPEVGCWIEGATVECDYCSASKSGEHPGTWIELAMFHGWTLWLDRLVVCPDCRERMGSVAA